MIKAVICDFDFTVYSHLKHCIPPSALDAFKKIKENGIKLFLATGRSPLELRPFPEILDVGFDAFILMNGQMCLDSKFNKLAGEPFSGKALDEVVDIFQNKKRPVVFVDEKSTYLNFTSPLIDKALESLSGLYYTIEDYKGVPPYLVVAHVTQEEQDEFAMSLPDCDIKRWGNFGVDIVPKGIDKITGISSILSIFGIDSADCLAVGDSFNDIGMIEYAGVGVAMGNGEQVLKDVADYVTTDIDDYGLANVFKHFNLI